MWLRIRVGCRKALATMMINHNTIPRLVIVTNSVNQGHGHGTKGRANLYDWIVLRRRYQAEEQKKVEERTRLYTQRQALSEPLTRLPCPCNAVISVFRYGTVTVIELT